MPTRAYAFPRWFPERLIEFQHEIVTDELADNGYHFGMKRKCLVEIAPIVERDNLKVLPFTLVIPLARHFSEQRSLSRSRFPIPYHKSAPIRGAERIRLTRCKKILKPDAAIFSKPVVLCFRQLHYRNKRLLNS